MKDVTLSKNGQQSLICFIAWVVILFFFSLISLWSSHSSYFPLQEYSVLAAVVVLIILSIFFGLKELRSTRFPLYWLIPTAAFVIILAVTLFKIYFSPPLEAIEPKIIGLSLDENSQGNIFVTTVTYQSPAEIAGIQNGDILKSVNGENIQSKTAFQASELIRASENEVDLTVSRNGEEITFHLEKVSRQSIEVSYGSLRP